MGDGLKALKEYRCQQQGVNVYADGYLDIVEKELKAFEIIKKLFDKYDFELINSYEDGEPVYILRLGTKHKKWVFTLVLTKEEYDLLKKVLS